VGSPGTAGLFAIDQRYEANIEECEPAEWVVTHIQTGFAVRRGYYTQATTRDEAIAVSQAFYKQAKAFGFKLDTTVPTDITDAHNGMSTEDKRKFWGAIYEAATP
jgi:hypothetical protein